MVRRLYSLGVLGLALALVGGATAGQGGKTKAEPGKTEGEMRALRTELRELRAELKKLRAALGELLEARRPSPVEELVKLDILWKKGALTEAEFNAKKKVLLTRPVGPPRPLTPMGELDKQIRAARDLYNRNVLTFAEYEKKRTDLLQQPVTLKDLKTDLELVQLLYSQNMITLAQRNDLKQRLLAGGPEKGK